MFQQITLVYVLIFLCAFLTVEGVFLLVTDTYASARRVNRRMRLIDAGTSRAEVYNQLRRRTSANADAFGLFAPAYAWLDELVAGAGISTPTQRILTMMALVGAGTAAAVLAAGSYLALDPLLFSLPAAIVAGLLLGVGLPVARLSMIKAKRLDKFHRQLPDALDCMAGSLRAGHPVAASMALVASEMPDPVGTEFGIAVDEMTYGLELSEALHNISERVPLEELRYVIVAISIQTETGGNLAEVLTGLADLIRSRFRMFMKVKALSAEGRLSMKILAVLPFLFAAMAFISRPEYYIEASEDPIFFPVVAVALFLELTGILIMHKLVNFRV